jgi:hypothetical protein
LIQNKKPSSSLQGIKQTQNAKRTHQATWTSFSGSLDEAGTRGKSESELYIIKG